MSTRSILTALAAVGAAMGWRPAAQAWSTCQLPNQAMNGASGLSLWIASDTSIQSGALPAESVSVATEVSVIRVRWWGTYYEGTTLTACPAPATDEFEIRLYEDDGAGLPGNIIHESLVSTVTRQPTGLTMIDTIFGYQYLEYRYEADLDAPVALIPNVDYWLSIRDIQTVPPDDLCFWAWETAPVENHSAVWLPTSGTWQAADVDLAFCLFDGNGIPAVSAWGQVTISLLVLIAGTVVLRRRAVKPRAV